MREEEISLGEASQVGSGEQVRAAPTSERPPISSRTRFAAGTVIGRYEVIRPLGQGGMGEVYLARDTRLGRRVALKFLLEVDDHERERFLVEARATAQLTHESIVAIYDIADHQGLPYMVLEYVQGKTLLAWLQERHDKDPARVALSPVRAAELMLPVARALGAAHEAGIVHRDLKLSNLMLSDSGTVKVLDFGIAKLLGDVSSHAVAARSMFPPPEEPASGHRIASPISDADLQASLLTDTDALVGTQAYMAPEQWGSREVDGRTDIWAVGIMLYQLVAGEHPLAPLSVVSLSRVLNVDEPMPSAAENIPGIGRLGAVIDRCLVKSMSDRLGSARELAAELEAIARPREIRDGDAEDAHPYAGLSSLKEGDAARFFGREGEVEQVIQRLGEQPLVAIVGSSGAGKSSLVRAGVIPALRRSGDAWDAFVLRPGPRPLAALAELLLQHSWQRSSDDSPPDSNDSPLLDLGDRDTVAAHLEREPGFLGVELRSRARRRREKILLFVDQFEEVVTLAAEGERGPFVDCLLGAADDDSAPVRVVLSIRQDFLDRVAGARQELGARMSRGAVLVGPMRPDHLRTALVRPAEMLDHRFESEALVSEMLGALAGTKGALPLLQFTAAKLWEKRDRERRLLTEQSYRSFGGVSGALASHADSVVAQMSPAERRWARAVLLRLVSPERTRAVVTLRELSELGGGRRTPPEGTGLTRVDLARVLGKMIDARLLTVEGAGVGESTVELVHESLIDSWPTLAQWIEEERGHAQFRARLRSAAREWGASGRTDGLVWRGEPAEEALRWWRRLGPEAELELRTLEDQYLRAVQALHDRERRRRRALLGSVIAGLCTVVLVVSAMAVRSNREREKAERSAASARNATRLAAARERQEDPTTVLALLREMEPGPALRGAAELARWARDAGVSTLVLRHDTPVRCAAWSPDGQRIVVASLDRAVRIWNADGTGDPLVFRGHEQPIVGAAWSPDGKRFATASWDRTVRVWNADGTGDPLVLRGHDDRVFFVAWSPDGKRIVSASEDKTARVWNADGTGSPLVLRGHAGPVHTAAFSPDGKHIVTASGDKTVRVWNADGTGDPLVLRGHDNAVYSAAFSPDGARLVSTSLDKTVRVWNAGGTGSPLVLRGHENTVYRASWSPDGKHIASASWDQSVLVWSADGTGQPWALRGHGDRVYTATWSPDGKRILSASLDKTVRVWKFEDEERPLVLRGHDGRVSDAAWSPDGRRIASASHDRTVRVSNADGTGQTAVLRGHDDLVVSVSWSPDGKRLASASLDMTVRLWNADGTGTPLVLRGPTAGILGAAWSPDGKRIAAGAIDKTVRIWTLNGPDGAGEPVVLRDHTAAVMAVSWSPDGKRLASGSDDSTASVWDVDGKSPPLVIQGHATPVFGITWTPDGRVVTASLDTTVRVWNVNGPGAPTEALVLRGHEGLTHVHDGAVTPDGKRLVSSGADGTVRIWSLSGGGEPLVLRASTESVNAAVWSPDGKHLLAASDDKTVIVWNDLEPLSGTADPKLWAATTYCMPLDVRLRLLNFAEDQSRADLQRCQARVRAAAGAPAPGR